MYDIYLEDLNDSELLMLYRENDENAKNLLYMKYKYIIELLMRKYHNVFVNLNIDLQEVYSECTVGFSDSLASYKDDKKTSLSTFITICIERRIRSILKKYNRDKYKLLHDSFSLDFNYEEGSSLIDFISDDNDPLKNITDLENCNELVSNVKNVLTKNEWDVFVLLISNFNYQEIARIQGKTPKQVDNTIQRIKVKVKKLLQNI